MITADSERRRRHIRHHTALLLTAMAALLAYCGWIVAAWDGILWSLVGGAVMLILVRRVPPGLVLHAIGARPVARWEAPVPYEIIDALCRRAGIERIPHLCWVGERFPVAFTIGDGEATTIALSEGLIRGMTAREIRGILAHEIVHVRNGDLALMQLAMVVGQLTRTVSQLAFLLVFFSLFLRTVSAPSFPIVPLVVLAVAPLGVGLLQLALSRTREGEADLEAAELTGESARLGVRSRQAASPGANAAARSVSECGATASAVAVSRSPGNRGAHSSSVGHTATARRRGSGR